MKNFRRNDVVVIYYAYCKDRSVDCEVNVNGHCRGNYHYCNYKSFKEEWKGYKLVKC